MNHKITQVVVFAGRVLVVALGYTLTLVAAGVVLGAVGLLSADTAVTTTDVSSALLWTFVASLAIGATLGLAARHIAAAATAPVLVWGTLLFANLAAVAIEGKFFAPELVPNLPAALLQQLLPCLVTAWLIHRLFAPRQEAAPIAETRFAETRFRIHRPWYSWLWRFGLSAFSYLAAYFVFGAINFALVTGPYYQAQGIPLDVPAPQIVLMAELVRAPLIVLSVLPFLLMAPMPRRRLVIWSGMLLFIIGGVVPLTWQIGSLPLPLLLASGVEIFCQNFATGAVAAWLLAAPSPAPMMAKLRSA